MGYEINSFKNFHMILRILFTWYDGHYSLLLQSTSILNVYQKPFRT